VCGDGTCNGTEAVLTCHKDCAPQWMTPGQTGFHGREFTKKISACTPCHGPTLEGGVLSCETCHPKWKTNCVFCHGGIDNQTGAPPVGLEGETLKTQRAVGAHTVHLSTTKAKQVACATCHTVPTDVFSPGHIDGDNVAEVILKDCRGGAYDYTAGTCSGVYCHGNGKAITNGGNATWTGAAMTCTSCHPTGGLSGDHSKHTGNGMTCATCHNQVMTNSTTFKSAALHVDCTKQVSGPPATSFSYNFSTKTCSNNSCHENRTW
jgi:predicted CxxxxCH...CXXCH cytochrome family protein